MEICRSNDGAVLEEAGGVRARFLLAGGHAGRVQGCNWPPGQGQGSSSGAPREPTHLPEASGWHGVVPPLSFPSPAKPGRKEATCPFTYWAPLVLCCPHGLLFTLLWVVGCTSHSVEARRGWVPCPLHLAWQQRRPLCLCEVGAWSHCLGWFTLKWWPGSPKLRPGWASRVSSCLKAPLWSLSSRCLITQKGPGAVLPAIRSIYSRGPRRQGSGRQFLGAGEVRVGAGTAATAGFSGCSQALSHWLWK